MSGILSGRHADKRASRKASRLATNPDNRLAGIPAGRLVW